MARLEVHWLSRKHPTLEHLSEGDPSIAGKPHDVPHRRRTQNKLRLQRLVPLRRDHDLLIWRQTAPLLQQRARAKATCSMNLSSKLQDLRAKASVLFVCQLAAPS